MGTLKDRKPVDVSVERKRPEKGALMAEMWADAAKAFEIICGESLQKGDVKGFDDVQRKIEGASKASYGIDGEQDDKWEKAKSVGLTSLKFLKMLVGAASQAASFIPIPSSAANITSSALLFVFDIPEAIKGYNDAIDQVFTEVSSALSQFQIYKSMDDVDPALIEKIHLVMVSFVKICAHVVKHRQGRKRDRVFRQIKSIFEDDSGLSAEMAEFKRVLQQQRDVEGTVTLAVVVETRHDIAMLLEQFIVFGKTTEETHQVVQDTQKGVQALKDDADRMKTLINIRDTLRVPETVRLDAKTTQTCSSICDKCLVGQGSWIWTHDAYTTWTAPSKGKETSSHALIVSGPRSSGKTSASALITRRLEEQKERTYVAHYFFPASIKKSDDDKYPVQSALKYMAFQIARVDATVLKALGKACEAGSSAFRRSASLQTLDMLWEELKIGTSGTGATYYLVFDGLENLPDAQAETLLTFVFGSKLTGESPGRVRVLVSGTDDQFANIPGGVENNSALRIQMEEHNVPDMRIMIQEALAERSMLQHPKPGSDQQRARDKIIEKLPQNVHGSYSLLQFGLDDVMRLLSTRSAVTELDRMLDQLMSSHEAAIKNLQRSLTTDEVSELNELLKWVLFTNEAMTLDQLEAVMFLYSGTESLASLEYIIRNKYSAVLKIDDDFVYGQDDVKDYLQKKKDDSSSRSEDRATISMSITINNMDQELCGHFLWDLAQKAIRDKFKFDFDAASALHSSSQAAIAVDEFEAHSTIVTRAFEYLDKGHQEQTKAIGKYIVAWLPYHLAQLRQLEDEDKGALSPAEQFEIGQNLYKLFKDEQVFRRHQVSFEQTWWVVNEIEDVHKWLMDSAVMRKVDKKWREEVQGAVSPVKGFVKNLAKVVVEGFLKERSWALKNAYDWVEELMSADDGKLLPPPEPPVISNDVGLSSSATTPHGSSSSDSSSFSGSDETSVQLDWERVSTWCQNFLGLSDSELDSLWYERLAELVAIKTDKSDIVLMLFQRAIEKENLSWLCHLSFGLTLSAVGKTQEAIEQVELALKEATREGAKPKPEARNIAELHVVLGGCFQQAGDMQRAAESYLIVCKSEDLTLANAGQLCYFKARLSSPDAEGTRQWLKDTLAGQSEGGTLASVLKLIARDPEHDNLMSKTFTVAKVDPDLLKGVVRAMEMATALPTPNKDPAVEVPSDDGFNEDEARGILLYDRGFAAYTYNVSPDGTEAVSEALRLWKESRELLFNVGGPNALLVRQDATTALAQHYFQSMVDKNHLGHIDALTKLAETDTNIYGSDSSSFLAALCALRGEKKRSRDLLARRITQALQILSDDIPDNDHIGLSGLQKALEEYQDFKNAAVTVSLQGQQDLVTGALYFGAEHSTEPDSMTEGARDLANKLGKETIEVVISQFPDISQQVERITAAKAHVESLVAASPVKVEPAVDGVDAGADRTQSQDAESQANAADLDTVSAHSALLSRLQVLESTHTPKVNVEIFSNYLSCDGRTADGEPCKVEADFVNEFYHCVYCSDRDFCRDCLARLRAPDSGPVIRACSAKHRWVRIPPQGSDLYVGQRAESVPVPKEVRPMEGDEAILEFYYGEGGDREEVTVEAWKEALATDWGISLEEIKK